MRLKSFIDEYEKSQNTPVNFTNLNESEWEILQKIADVLKTAFDTTKFLQRNNITLSDVYGEWIMLQHAVTKKISLEASTHGIDLAKYLKDSLVFYQGRLFANPMMVAAIFLDPRFKGTMKLSAKSLAISKLTKLWMQLKRKNPLDQSRYEITEDDKNATLSDLLAEQERELCCNLEEVVVVIESEEDKIHRQLQKFYASKRENADINVLKYWEDEKLKMPELYELSQLVYCNSATQVATERSFSALTFIFNNYRTNLKPHILTAILIIKANKDLFEEIVKQHLLEISQN